jgi:hypothetical protein
MLKGYLVDGKSVRDLAQETGETESHVRSHLAGVGIRVSADEIRDPVCAAVCWSGYESFSRFVSSQGLQPYDDQAAELGVSANALKRIHDIFLNFVTRATDG